MNLRSIPCPNCKRKGLHHPDEPHAYGWKDCTKAVCRFCGKRFTIKEKQHERQIENKSPQD
jgi:hypothetical protein